MVFVECKNWARKTGKETDGSTLERDATNLGAILQIGETKGHARAILLLRRKG